MSRPNQALRFGFLIFALSVFSGCTTNTDIYYWGNYEQLVYEMYAEPGDSDPMAQVETLTTDIELAEIEGKPVPPGVYAHLGMMHALAGNREEAMGAFNVEKKLYPESVVLIDGMIARSANQGQD